LLSKELQYTFFLSEKSTLFFHFEIKNNAKIMHFHRPPNFFAVFLVLNRKNAAIFLPKKWYLLAEEHIYHTTPLSKKGATNSIKFIYIAVSLYTIQKIFRSKKKVYNSIFFGGGVAIKAV